MSMTIHSYLPHSERDYDPEQFADQELPILIVGTKLVSVALVFFTGYSYSSKQTSLIIIVAALGSNGRLDEIIVQYQQCGGSF